MAKQHADVVAHGERLHAYLEVIDAALGRGGEDRSPRPELWTTLNADTPEVATVLLDAAATRARELRRLVMMARAAKAEADKEVNLANARLVEYEKALDELEDNLVRPLCEEFGSGKTHQFDTGFSRVALVRKPPSVVLDATAKRLDPADVVTMLPRELVRIKPPEPDKEKIREALKAGVVVPGFELSQGETRVEWRS